MELLLSVFFWISGIVLGVLLFSFSAWLTGSSAKFKHYAVYTMFLCLLSAFDIFFQDFLLSTLLIILLLYWSNRRLLRNRFLISAITSVLAFSISQLSFGIFNSLTSLILPYMKVASPAIWISGVLSSIFSLILFYSCSRFIAHYYPLEKDISHEYLLMLLAPSLFLCVMGHYIVNTVYSNVVVLPFPIETGKHLSLILIQALGFLVLFSTLYAYGKLCDSFREKSLLALLEQETHAQKTYVAEARTRYEKTISFRHDFKNHLSVLDGLLKTDQIKQANDYLEKLKAAAAQLSLPIHTGNPVVDILVGSKLEPAAQLGIKADVSLTIPQPCAVDDLDLCIIFSNAFDNAVNACSLLPEDAQKSIRISGEQQGDFYLLEFVNDCESERTSAPEAGTGLLNLKTVAEKYGGAITIERRETKFYLHILLNIS